MEKHIQQELEYQKECRDELIYEAEYRYIKGEITDLHRDALLDKIDVDYRVIVNRILSEKK